MRIEGADEGAVFVDAGDDGGEALADARVQDDGGDALLHLTLDLARAVFHQRAMDGDGIEIVHGIGLRRLGEPGLEQPLRDHVGEAAVGRGGVGVVLDSEAEVAGGSLVGLDQHVLAGAHELDDRQRQVREVVGVLLLLGEEEVVERL